MKTIIGLAAVAGVATLTLMRSVGAPAPSRPPGVSESDWAPISDTVGIVLVDQVPGADNAPEVRLNPQGAGSGLRAGNGGTVVMWPVSGYLMI
jgi:hypothetical protein